MEGREAFKGFAWANLGELAPDLSVALVGAEAQSAFLSRQTMVASCPVRIAW